MGWSCALFTSQALAIDIAPVVYMLHLFNFLGIEVTTTTSPSSLVVGQSVTFGCTSDLDLTVFEWYRGDTLVATQDAYQYSSQLGTTLFQISTNDEGEEYKCKVRSPYGTQERSFILHTIGTVHSVCFLIILLLLCKAFC